MQRAMDLSGIPTAPPAGVGVAPNLLSPRSDGPSVAAIRTAARDLPSPTFSPRQIGVMEQILRNEVPEDGRSPPNNSMSWNGLPEGIFDPGRSRAC